MRRRIVPIVALAVLLLTSLAASAFAAPRTDKHWVCHGTASAKNPYVLIWIDGSALPAHLGEGPYTRGMTGDQHGHRNNPDIYLYQGPHSPRPDVVQDCVPDTGS
jgi:hypothetical protein